MKRIYYREDSHGFWLSILMIVIGLVLTLWPGHVMTTALTILGVAMLAGGVISILSWYKGRMRGVGALTLAEGILLAVLGLIFLTSQRFLISIIPFAVGGIIVINGIFNLAQALDQRREHYDRWNLSLILAILTLVLGLLIMLNPFSTMEMLVIAIGIIIIYNGVSNLLIELGYRRMYR